MKKFAMIAMLLVGSVALAASLNVPWYADNSPAGAGIPPSSGALTLVGLHNNLSTSIECDIMYYAADGTPLDQANDADSRLYCWAPDYHTFVIAPNATIQFRPVEHDPSTSPGGQESASGMLVPNRPRFDNGDPEGWTLKKNGSIVVTWSGEGWMVQGRVAEYRPTGQGMAAFLLPAGA